MGAPPKNKFWILRKASPATIVSKPNFLKITKFRTDRPTDPLTNGQHLRIKSPHQRLKNIFRHHYSSLWNFDFLATNRSLLSFIWRLAYALKHCGNDKIILVIAPPLPWKSSKLSNMTKPIQLDSLPKRLWWEQLYGIVHSVKKSGGFMILVTRIHLYRILITFENKLELSRAKSNSVRF